MSAWVLPGVLSILSGIGGGEGHKVVYNASGGGIREPLYIELVELEPGAPPEEPGPPPEDLTDSSHDGIYVPAQWVGLLCI